MTTAGSETAAAPAGAAAPPVLRPASPGGDPQAARRLAAAFSAAADALDRATAMASGTVAGLAALWAGTARHAAAVPLDTLDRQSRELAHGLRQSSDALVAYARRLEGAQHEHAMSVANLVTLGAVVAVTATAVVVTMGAGAVVVAGADAALAGGLAGLTEAATVGAAAEAGAASGLLGTSFGSMVSVRAFTAWALPHLVEAEVNAGTAAGTELLTTGQITGRNTGEAGAFGFVGSVGATKALQGLANTPWWTAASTTSRRVAEHAVGAAASSATSAGQQLLDTGRVDAGATVRDTAISTGVSAGRSAVPTPGRGPRRPTAAAPATG
jgi:uncharacterized protein YukE